MSSSTGIDRTEVNPRAVGQHAEARSDVDRKDREEEIGQHVETMEFIDEAELKGDIDIAATALRGQDLSHFTVEGNFLAQLHIGNKLTSFEERRKVLRKIDWHILPLAAWSCGLQFVDKVRYLFRHQKLKKLMYEVWTWGSGNVWPSDRSGPTWQPVLLVCFGTLC